jgi:hypothetical protein
VLFIGQIRISAKCYPRSFTVNITGAAAQEFAETANFFMIFDAYWAKSNSDSPAEGVCGEPTVIVECKDAKGETMPGQQELPM